MRRRFKCPTVKRSKLGDAPGRCLPGERSAAKSSRLSAGLRLGMIRTRLDPGYDSAMFELSVQRVFSAAHALTLAGKRETLHGHDWHLTVVVAGARLDADGLLCDFHVLASAIDAAIAPFHNANLNEVEPFTRINPSAEQVARYIAQRLASVMPDGVSVARVSVTEAPGCQATYTPGFPCSN